MGLVFFPAPDAGADQGTDVQQGHFDLSWTADELLTVLGLDVSLESLDADETVSWRLYVPETYDPQEPAGLLVYISPTPRGQLREDWWPIMEQENLIWISANGSGNQTATKKRILLASLAPYVAAEYFAIDPTRIYLSGFSGGGKAAGIASIHLAGVFKGAIFICGAELWKDIRADQFEAAKLNRYVFITGSRDFNRMLTKKVHRDYARAGLINTKLMVIPNMDHRTPDAAEIREAISYLDGRNP